MILFLDLEMLTYDMNSMIAIGLTSLNGKMNFHSTVHPGYKRISVTKYTNKLTGITKEQLQTSPSFPEIFGMINERLKPQLNAADGVTFYTWGENDLTVWNNVCNRYNIQSNFMFVDFQKILMEKCKLINPPSLIKTIELVNRNYILEHHNPLNDAKMLKSIYKKYHKFPNEVRLVLKRVDYEKELIKLKQKYQDVIDYQLEELML